MLHDQNCLKKQKSVITVVSYQNESCLPCPHPSSSYEGRREQAGSSHFDRTLRYLGTLPTKGKFKKFLPSEDKLKQKIECSDLQESVAVCLKVEVFKLLLAGRACGTVLSDSLEDGGRRS